MFKIGLILVCGTHGYALKKLKKKRKVINCIDKSNNTIVIKLLPW